MASINWVTALWSLAAGACITLAAMHLLAWCWDRTLHANLWLAGTALSVALVAGLEWSLMHTRTPAEFLAIHRWGHAATFLTIVGIVGFVQAYFRTGRPWLAWTVVCLRALIVVLAFVPGPTFNFRELTALLPFKLLGETVVVPQGTPTPWARIGESSVLFLVAFVVDAAVTLWLRGDPRERQRALVVGGGMTLFFLACLANALAIHTGWHAVPYFISFSFMFIVATIGIELSRDLGNAARYAAELRENAERISELRRELAHVARATTLNELSGSLAHELNQPLAIILTNAQAAQRLLDQSPPDLAEVRDILADIVAEDQHAGEVIQRIRNMLKRGDAVAAPVALSQAVEDVLHLAHPDLAGRGIVVVPALAENLLPVLGDRVQLQQVALNFILNGADAMVGNAEGERRLYVATSHHGDFARVSVSDEGCGLPPDTEKLFAPFFTTKPHGLGMGLAICRSIVIAHGGRLWAEPHPHRGAVFHFELPVIQDVPA